MKILATEAGITLFDQVYSFDVKLATYAESRQPAILLDDTVTGERGTVATCSIPAEWLTGFPIGSFCAKTYSENEGLWPQLLSLQGSDGEPLFLDTGKKITLSAWVTAPIYQLNGEALWEYKAILASGPPH